MCLAYFLNLFLLPGVLVLHKTNAVFVNMPSCDLCPFQAISRMGGLWKKLHTVWVNVGGLHAGVYLLKRTAGVFGQTPEDVHESPGRVYKQTDEKDDG